MFLWATFPPGRGLKALDTDNEQEGKKERKKVGTTILQVMRTCTMHGGENVNRAAVGFSSIQSNSWKDVFCKDMFWEPVWMQEWN